ncbi:SDR family NAD(P)-dependent oxidoreductase [Bradyrhizobium genosp. P]|uniref:SDR family NAD(P)-dependent oxidoreductase n=1 Tax=Bradyrhizobium genosp. P TaxID=83641 RepID=UPI003CF71DBD
MKADLSLIGEAGRVAMALPAETLDLLVFTTGIMAGPQREVTADGIEQDLAISYLSRFVILKRIASRLGVNRTRSGMKPRVFVMGFPGSNQTADVGDLNSERGYGRIKAHSNTVAGNEVLVLDFARRFPGIDVFGLNPGFVKTNIRANLLGSKKLLAAIEWFFLFMALEPDIYAKRLTPLLVSPDLTGHSGAMFNNKAEAIMPSTRSTEPDYAAALMAASETVVSLVGSK